MAATSTAASSARSSSNADRLLLDERGARTGPRGRSPPPSRAADRRRCPGRTRRWRVAVRVVSVSRGSATTTVRVGSSASFLNVSVALWPRFEIFGLVPRTSRKRARACRRAESRRRRVEHPLVEQVVLGLLLREGVEPAPRADAAQERHRIRRVHVVALPADADQRDRRAANGARGCRSSLRGDLGDRRRPSRCARRCRRAAAASGGGRGRRARRSARCANALLQT